MSNSKMIVADEPKGNLDKQTEEEILEIFKDLAHKDGKCVIIVTPIDYRRKHEDLTDANIAYATSLKNCTKKC